MKQATQRRGYQPGCRQPSLVVVLRIRQSAETAQLEALDHWLAATLDLDHIPPPARLPSPRTVAEQAWRALAVSAFLQQEARMPVFDPGQILQIEPDPGAPGAWSVRARVACLDQMPIESLSRACHAALQIVEMGLENSSNGAQLEDKLGAIESKVIKPLRAVSHSGISTLPILREAFRLDIPFRHLGGGVYQLGWGSRSRLMNRSALDSDSAIGSRLASNKLWSAQLLRASGLPAPEHFLVNSELQAKESAAQLDWPLVIKPADRERSEGVTVSIRDEAGLERGYRHAQKYSKLILVEREVPGTCYRLMVGNSRLLYAVRRNPKSVTGDGLHSVAQLIELERERNLQTLPWRRGKPIGLDVLCEEALAAQGISAHYRPSAGEKVKLRLIESTEWGGDVVNATSEVHADNVAIALRAARLFGLDNAGIDIISPDISQPWHRNGAIINEVNFAPQFGATNAAREKMPEFLRSLIEGDGRIPIEAFVGGKDALDAGLRRRAELAHKGLNCWCTSHAESFDGSGASFVMPGIALFDRAQALLLDRDVDALILIIQTSELLTTGLPADRLTQIHRCAGNVSNQPGDELQDDSALTNALLRLLLDHSVEPVHQ